MEDHTVQLQRLLKENGFKSETIGRETQFFRRLEKGHAHQVTFTFVGGGLVDKYIRRYPSGEKGCYIRVPCSEFLGPQARELF